ncbi:hypothetical protein KC333_g135 [Hortaea werneckii]|nr:hypothetical protein KC333_g135 [Hortaea werneckii]
MDADDANESTSVIRRSPNGLALAESTGQEVAFDGFSEKDRRPCTLEAFPRIPRYLPIAPSSKPSPTVQLALSSPSFMLLSWSLVTQTDITALAIFSNPKVDIKNTAPIANTKTGPDMHTTPLTLRLLTEVWPNKARDTPR